MIQIRDTNLAGLVFSSKKNSLYFAYKFTSDIQSTCQLYQLRDRNSNPGIFTEYSEIPKSNFSCSP